MTYEKAIEKAEKQIDAMIAARLCKSAATLLSKGATEAELDAELKLIHAEATTNKAKVLNALKAECAGYKSDTSFSISFQDKN